MILKDRHFPWLRNSIQFREKATTQGRPHILSDLEAVTSDAAGATQDLHGIPGYIH
jgi:hypothetical protein